MLGLVEFTMKPHSRDAVRSPINSIFCISKILFEVIFNGLISKVFKEF